MKNGHNNAQRFPNWLNTIIYLFSPDDTSMPHQVAPFGACAMNRCRQTWGYLKLAFWMMVAIALAFLLATL